MNITPLSKEDYEEPACLLDMHPEIRRIPVRRVLDRLDHYLGRNDIASAEKHLIDWLREAEEGNDRQGKLTVLNEQIGLYRKINREAECMTAIDAALELTAELGIEETVTGGTTFINAATGYKAFDKAELALPLYQRARSVYENRLSKDDDRLAGLYNNMALTLTELGSFGEAEELFGKALEILAKQERGEAEMAITYLNLADLVCAGQGPEAGEKLIYEYLDRAEALLDSDKLPRNGYYAFVCEKCAPAFGYYGYFMTERELKRRAEEIYERA